MGQTTTMTLADGRTLEYRVDGPGDGAVLLFHHGTPGAAVAVPYITEAAAARGLRTVGASRPGYGASSPRPGRRVADVGADAVELLDHLGAPTCVTAGWSGGGPHALAAAVVLGARCRGVATIAGVAPHDAAGLDWLAGMGEENQVEFAQALAGADEIGPALDAARPELLTADKAALIESMAGLLPDVDLEALDGPMGDEMVASFRRALAAGVEGWRDDDLAFVRPWGVDPMALAVPITVWQGDRDLMVPEAHGRWLAGNLPSAEARVCAGDGHLSIVARHAAEIVDGLVAALG